ncbi:MAG: (2Fe-2S)-binding protein [Brevibacillus sp.]|nr:(2Fe-2S)-binding protein [Brevibacillus sp.]
MLSYEDNKMLTETGPDTPMGNLFRRYWVPVVLSVELPKPDGPPIRVKLLGEKLVAFRDSHNNVGLIDEHCPHRRASMFFGRNEEGGLRCVYHGWKFDTCGKCVDMPSEPPESNFKEKVSIKAYPCREMGGIVWAYMGPPEDMPELPKFEFSLVPDHHRIMSRRLQENNYFQAVEGGIDSSHISFLHRHERPNQNSNEKVINSYGAPKFEVAKTDYGLLVAAKRETNDPANVYWRISQFVMPWYALIPPVFTPHTRVAHAWVPMDDENCWHWSITWTPLMPYADEDLKNAHHVDLIPGTLRPMANKDNDYLIDRKVQASGQSFTGIAAVSMQDAAVQESPGPITDRTRERLGTSDTAIIVARRVMLNAAMGMQKRETPPGLNLPYIPRAVSIMLPAEVPFQEGAKDKLVLKEDDYISAESVKGN